MGERQRHVLGPRRLVGPLDQRVRHPGRVAVGQVGLQGDLRPRLLAGGDQQRRVVGLGVEDRPHRVADPGRGVQVDDGGLARGLGVAVGHPDHDRLLQAEHVAEVRGEVGEHRQLGRARVAEHRRHPVGAEEVEGRVADRGHRREPYPAGFKTGTVPVSIRPGDEQPCPSASGDGAERIGLAIALACAALLCLAATRLAPARRPPTRLVYAPGKIVPIPASIPHEEGDMVDRRILPDLRWIAQRYPIYVTDGYSGPLPNGEHVGCDECHVQRLRPLQRARRRPRAARRRDQMRRHLGADHRPRPLGRAGPERAGRRPSAGSATKATPATAAATTSTSPGTTPRRAQFQLAEWVEVFPVGPGERGRQAARARAPPPRSPRPAPRAASRGSTPAASAPRRRRLSPAQVRGRAAPMAPQVAQESALQF